MGDYLLPSDSTLYQLFQIMVLPFQRVYTLLMSLIVGDNTSLGGLIIIGILVSIVIGVITHYAYSHSPSNLGAGINKKGDN